MSQQDKKNESIVLSRAQSRRVDQIAIEDYGIPGIVLMENAARNASDIIFEQLQHRLASKGNAPTVLIACGGGNNGGDGYAIARHLHNRGVEVALIAAVPGSKLSGDARINHDIAQRMNLPIAAWPSGPCDAWLASESAVVVDALLGTGFSGDVRSPMDELINRINGIDAYRVAIDVPSGLDCQSGQPSNATVRADMTVTFVASKTGFTQSAAEPLVGGLKVVDIGAPNEIVQRVLERDG